MASERFFLPIVLSLIPDYREAKASEVTTSKAFGAGTENELRYHVLPTRYEL